MLREHENRPVKFWKSSSSLIEVLCPRIIRVTERAVFFARI